MIRDIVETMIKTQDRTSVVNLARKYWNEYQNLSTLEKSVAIGCNNKQTTGIDLTNLDTTAVAQNDFYQYACGGWMAKNPLTPEFSRYGSFDKVREQNQEQLDELIGTIAAKKA